MLVRTIIDLSLKRYLRADQLTGRAAGRLARLLLVELPALGMAVLAGYLLGPFVEASAPAPDVVGTAGTLLAYGCILLAISAPLIRKEMSAPLRPYLVLPVRQSTLVHLYQSASFFHVVNTAVLLFIGIIWWKHVAGAYGWSEALAWLLAAILMLKAAHHMAMVLRRHLALHTTRTLAVLAAVLVLLILDVALRAYSVDRLAAVLTRLLDGEMMWLLGPLLVWAVAYAYAFRAVRGLLRVDVQEAPARVRKRRQGRPATSAGPYTTLLRMQERLLLRNARARFLIINVATFSLFGAAQLFLGLKTGTTAFTLIGVVLVTTATGLGFAAHAFRMQSVFFDGLSVWPTSSRELARTVLLSAHLLTTMAFLLVLPIAYFARSDALGFVGGLYLFSMGVANPLFAFAGTFEKNRFDITLSAFSTRGSLVSHPFLNHACTLVVGAVPVALLLIGGPSPGVQVGLPLALLGIAGLTGHRAWTRLVARNLDERRYLMREGFRA